MPKVDFGVLRRFEPLSSSFVPVLAGALLISSRISKGRCFYMTSFQIVFNWFLRNFGAVSQELQILLQAGALFGFLGNAEENTTYQIGR